MEVSVIVSENEILKNPNDSQLGELIRKKYWEQKETENKFDKCVLCGKKTPYTQNTHIDYRIGYVEGSGQGCFQPKVCDEGDFIIY